MSLSEFNSFKAGRIIAVLDISGFSKFIENINNEYDFEKSKILLSLTNSLSGSKEKRAELIKPLSERFDEGYVKRAVESFECTAISDTLVISYEWNPVSLLLLIQEISLMQWDLIWKWNFLSRGYIGSGELYHKGNVLFGKGFIDCFNACEKNDKHKNPCTLVENELLSLFKGSEEGTDVFFREDRLPDHRVLDYTHFVKKGITYTSAQISPQEQLAKAKQFVESGIKRNTCPKILEKYRFTLDIVNEAHEYHKPYALT